MMKRLLGLIAALMMMSGLAGTSWATLYQLNDTVGAGSVTGTIGTDGHLGILAMADITSWDLLLSDGSNTFHLTGPSGNSNFLFSGSGNSFTATANGLFFNFSNTTGPGDYVDFIASPVVGVGDYLCLQDTNGKCSSNPSDFVVEVNPDSRQIMPEVGVVQIATAVPEPASIALLIAGLAWLGFFRRRKALHRAAQGGS
jgi:hypothetical protein